MKLTDRHKAIIEIVKSFEPITSDEIAEKLSLGKSTLRNDLAVLGMLEVLEAKPNVVLLQLWLFTGRKKGRN